jgi:predicted phage-related endonuclease
LEDSELLVDGDGRPLCTWKNQTSPRLDTAALKSEMPDVAARYLKETHSRVFRLAKETMK